VYKNFSHPKDAINSLIGNWGHDFKNQNSHFFTSDGRLVFDELINNKEAEVKYIYHNEFTNDEGDKIVKIDEMNVDEFISDDKPLCYHVYNNKRVNFHFNDLSLFYSVYNISNIKLHQLAEQIGGVVRGIFTDTLIIENPVNIPKFDSKTIGGIRKTEVKPYDGFHLLDTTPRTTKFSYIPHQMVDIDNFNLTDDKGCFITGYAGSGKSTLIKKLQQQLQENEYISCTPTHKSALIIGGSTIYNAFSIDPRDHSYMKSTVKELKNKGLKWVFIDEVSMINSQLWAVLRDIKKCYNFRFVLTGDFGQLPAVETYTYDVESSEVFSELCDGQRLELKVNYRAINDPQYASFLDDLVKIRNGQNFDKSSYGKKECRKSLCWTNGTRHIINQKCMNQEAINKKYIIMNEIKFFVGLPIISNKTFSIKDIEIKNNEEFEVVDISPNIVIKNERGEIKISQELVKNFDLAYCITVHKSQGSTYDFEFSIYESEYFDKKLLYTAVSRSTQKSYVNFCKTKYSVDMQNLF
jgi:hypothetical protein